MNDIPDLARAPHRSQCELAIYHLARAGPGWDRRRWCYHSISQNSQTAEWKNHQLPAEEVSSEYPELGVLLSQPGLDRDLGPEAEAEVTSRLLRVPESASAASVAPGLGAGLTPPRSDRSDSDSDRGTGIALISANTRFLILSWSRGSCFDAFFLDLIWTHFWSYKDISSSDLSALERVSECALASTFLSE